VLSSEQGFPLWLAHGTALRDWALAEQGQGEEGIAQIRQGLADYQATGAEYQRPYWLALLAEASGKVGRAEEGLSALAEALASVNKIGGRCYEAELYRLKGELLLAQGGFSPDYSRTKRESWEVAENNAMRVATLTTRDHRREKEREARTAARELRCLRAGEDELLPADARATARRGRLSMRGAQLRGGQDREPRKCRRQAAEYPRQGKGEGEPDKHATRRLRDQCSHF